MTAVPAGRQRCGGLAAAALVVLGLLAGCTSGGSSGPAATPAASPSSGVSAATASPSAAPTVSPEPAVSPDPSEPAEPTTTNTLAPPPEPTGPAPSTAGDLDAAVLPVPAGWRTQVREGGEEEGFEGNGTWVRARDARYAAQDVITIGCTEVTRDDYPDPVRALEGGYTDGDGSPGIGLVLEFEDAAAASGYWDRYTEQVRACATLADPVRTDEVAVRQPADGDALMDRRTYPDGEWTEVGVRRGDRVTLVILNDQHRTSRAAADLIVDQVR